MGVALYPQSIRLLFQKSTGPQCIKLSYPIDDRLSTIVQTTLVLQTDADVDRSASFCVHVINDPVHDRLVPWTRRKLFSLGLLWIHRSVSSLTAFFLICGDYMLTGRSKLLKRNDSESMTHYSQ